MPSTEEVQCLNKLIAGQDAWDEFWRLLGKHITAEVLQFDFADRQLVADTFQLLVLRLLANDYKVIRKYLKNPHSTSFAAMLRRITRNLMIDEYRRRARRKELSLFESALPKLETCSIIVEQNPDVVLARHRALCDVISQVTGGDEARSNYQIMYLRFADGMSVKRIAAQLSMRPNTVSHRIRYYVGKLRKH